MCRNETVTAKEQNQGQGLDDGGGDQWHECHSIEKALATDGCSGQGIGKKEGESCGDGHGYNGDIEAVIERPGNAGCAEIFDIVAKGKIFQAKDALFEKTHDKNFVKGKEHEEDKKKGNKDGHGGQDIPVDR